MIADEKKCKMRSCPFVIYHYLHYITINENRNEVTLCGNIMQSHPQSLRR